jgi:hypothetical protein
MRDVTIETTAIGQYRPSPKHENSGLRGSFKKNLAKIAVVNTTNYHALAVVQSSGVWGGVFLT